MVMFYLENIVKKSIKCREIRKRQYQLQKKKNVHTYKLDK